LKQIHIIYSIAVISLQMFGNANICSAKGIIPDRTNQIIIYSNLTEAKPTFYLIFSAKPIPATMDRAQLQSLVTKRNRKDLLILKMHGKEATKPGRFDYFFGTIHDPNRPWNNGDDFHWQDWENYSADLWDNIAVAYEPPPNKKFTKVAINHIVIRRGGMRLFDSRAKNSHPNKHKILFPVSKRNLWPTTDKYPLLCLGRLTRDFKSQFYELRGDILKMAYGDLGQTDKTKYANRGHAWCSEFASYIYRANGIDTPDPNAMDVHWKNLRAYFEKNGTVYTQREVSGWSNNMKRKLIKPGSIVSILTHEGKSTHTIIFTTWRYNKGKAIESYTGISGCNKGMVWAHPNLPLPPLNWSQGKTDTEISNFDQKCFFGVPDVANKNADRTCYKVTH